MEKIMIFNVPAQELGALTVLKNTYNDIDNQKNNNKKYYFILSGPYISETENIKVKIFPWVKKSWFHRLFFDYFIAPRIVKTEKIESIISYHNLSIPRVKINQTLFIHNAIPFTDLKFSLIKETRLWIYKNIMSRRIKSSINKADQLIVQSEWLKKRILQNLTMIKSNNILVEKYYSEIDYNNQFDHNSKSLKKLFIYPAGPYSYKNHIDIINACKKLNKDNIEIIFTINGEENIIAKNIKKEIEFFELPIKLVGSLSHNQVLEYFKTHILIFPSKLETLGLPLLEAKSMNTPIIYRYSELYEEVLDNYKYAIPYDTFSDLKMIIDQVMD
ncbi:MULTISPECIES: glycosyltransferase [unclassified Exiguobacterium]|uniref:glycosyltransferase n=1 Tax=unclassified Exiguobacterium TaxID=2644629 RepID=UPI001AE2923E|nr:MULTISPECIES: glycosyltransferase [unclassified Exiguobacterium]